MNPDYPPQDANNIHPNNSPVPQQPQQPYGPQPQYPQYPQDPQNLQSNPQNQYGLPPQQKQPQQPQQPYSQAPQNGYIQPPLQPNPYSGYNPSPYPGEESKPKSKKLVFIIVGAVVLLGAIAAIAVVSSKTGQNTGTPQATETHDQQPGTVNAGSDIVPRTDGQLDLSVKADTSKSIKEQTIKAKTKEQINLSSGFSFMANKIEAYTSNDAAVKPAAGKQFVVVSIVVGNRAQTNSLSVSYLDFKLRDKDSTLLSAQTASQQILSNILANPSALKPGEQLAGKVVFEVNATDTDWVLIHKETYQKTTDNTTFNVEGDAVVTLTPTASTDSGTTTTPSPGPTPANTTTPPATPPASST